MYPAWYSRWLTFFPTILLTPSGNFLQCKSEDKKPFTKQGSSIAPQISPSGDDHG